MSGLVGRKVKVTFDTTSWPVHHGTYIYEGYDETGHFVRRADGVQRHFEFGDVQHIELIPEDEELGTEDY